MVETPTPAVSSDDQRATAILRAASERLRLREAEHAHDEAPALRLMPRTDEGPQPPLAAAA